MKSLLSVLTIVFFFIGTQLVLLGALYKIQSWEMPAIGGLTINILAIGLVMEGIAFTLLALKNSWSQIVQEERLELDEQRLDKVAEPEPLKNEDDLLL
tara:strand:+ start:55 stop:348 length:294 start_codon:yes stop_codon:yes gene_type:complete